MGIQRNSKELTKVSEAAGDAVREAAGEVVGVGSVGVFVVMVASVLVLVWWFLWWSVHR